MATPSQNDFIHKFPLIIRVENPGSSKDSEDLILEVEGDLCSRLSHQGEQDMEFGPVIHHHVMTNPLECVVEPMLCINEINLQSEKRV